ncbi:PilZ domain-containing protein [Devosia sp. XJ19-1]|uniref:PilZ domain-containing protein n=1 Tax=Devosia ureilytica TaxID=2952754 RepID=A0A9Q4ALD6_9HYPH|nr:PilZ domain-containing protein [Devosia ureilytica]MCP8882352.1 PilZ domain-containing protein [Devosia ureilytica]MCP8885761.1 PilZ domain-containing protein [Devosia ureilytica]
MTLTAALDDESLRANFKWNDVRFIGALAGRYALPDRRRTPDDKVPVYACRLCSISTRMLVAVGPVVGKEGEVVSSHFNEFGILRGRITRRLASGFVTDLQLTDGEREKLGAKIEWHKKHVHAQVPDKREHRRIQPRDPRSLICLADGQRVPCFVVDVSRSGAAVSAHYWPDIGTPMALGRIVARVVRHLDVGFAVQFVQEQEFEELEALIKPPAD